MALARDIKAKIDKKQVRTSWKPMGSCWPVLIFLVFGFSLCSCASQEGNNPQGSSQGVKITDQPKKSSFFRCTLL